MQHLDTLNELIDHASKTAGSDYKLAKQLAVPFQTVSSWRHGRKTCMPADQAILAHVAGLDPVQVLARATVEAYEGKPKGDALMKALGKALLVTGGAIGSAGASATAIFSTTPALSHALEWLAAGLYTMYIGSTSVDTIRVMSSAFALKKCKSQ